MTERERSLAAAEGAPLPLHLIDCSPLLAELPGARVLIPQFSLTSASDGELLRATVEIRVERTNRGVRLVGRVHGVQEGACARCLNPARAELEARIDEEVVEERFAQGDDERIGRGNAIDVGRIGIEGLDLVRRLVLHCDPLCPQRCEHCGAPHQADECPERELDPRLASLRRLLPSEGEDPEPYG